MTLWPWGHVGITCKQWGYVESILVKAYDYLAKEFESILLKAYGYLSKEPHKVKYTLGYMYVN